MDAMQVGILIMSMCRQSSLAKRRVSLGCLFLSRVHLIHLGRELICSGCGAITGFTWASPLTRDAPARSYPISLRIMIAEHMRQTVRIRGEATVQRAGSERRRRRVPAHRLQEECGFV